MVAQTKCQNYIEELTSGNTIVFGTTNTFKAALHSDAMVAATDTSLTDLTQVTGTGYVAGGADIQNDADRTGDTVTMTAVDNQWTAGAGDWGTFQYIGFYDDTSTGDYLMSDVDYGSGVALGNGETFTITYGASLGTWA